MNPFWLLAIFIICINGRSTEGASRPAVVNVGAVFAVSTINGGVSKIAIKAAEKDVNSDPTILSGTKLSVSIHDSNYSGFLSIMGGIILLMHACLFTCLDHIYVFIVDIGVVLLITALRYMESDTVAIIGPQTSVMAHIISHIANELHVPLLSFTALDPTLSSLQYPYFLQTAPNDQFQMSAIGDMVSYFGWNQVVAVFTDDDQSRNGVTALGDRLAEKMHKISYKAVLPPDPTATRDQVKNELLKIQIMESRVIVLHTFSKTGLLVFDVAKELGMMESGYVWIASSWLSTVLDSKTLSEKTKDSIQGALTLRPHTPDSKRKRDFISRWNKLSNGSIGLNPYGLYAYDTVWMIAHAVNLLLDQGGTISFSNHTSIPGFGGGTLNLGALSIFNGGKQLLEHILQTNMTGLTGPLAFHSDRSPMNPSYDVINIIENGYQQIGYWSNNSRLSVVPPEAPSNRSSSDQHLGVVLWPGGTTDKPRGWVFPNNGKKLRIGVPNRVSYRDIVSRKDGTDTAEGYCIDIFLAAIKLLPYPVPYKFVFFGDGHENPSYYELVEKIALGVSKT